ILTTFPERIIWNNQPPPGEYILGTGDEVIIEIWGDTQLRAVHIIDQYGKINIDKIGQINLSGLALKDLQSKLISKFQNVYSSLKGPDETAYLDISLGKLKSINVTFVGESISPGIHAIHSFSTIITGLMQTGGISQLGSLRDIQIIRNGKKAASLDIYDYLSNGDAGNDRRLLDGDIVFIPIRYSTIFVRGEVMRPAIYELLSNETLDDIVHFAGGLTAFSQKVIRVDRLESSTESSTTHLINFNTQPSFVLENGDAIEVYEIPASDHQIYIFGQVKNPGSFAFDTEKETLLLDVLELAGGINDETYAQTIYTDVGEIIRNHPETNYPEIIKFNIDKLIAGDKSENKPLQNWDIILIRENPNYTSPAKVSLMGEVNVPGIYTLQKRWENLDDMIQRAGGFTDQAFHDGIQLYRKNSQVALNDFEIILLDGDSLMVPEHPGIVEVLGEVNRSGYIQYDKKKSLDNYIENAGGFTEYSDKNNITVIYANGDVTVKKYFRSPKVTEGATIIVNKKEETEPFSMTIFATNLASIITSLATLILLIND
ncbi:MAG: SLBB domain-containing protein, partial [Candidatus Marinimicrobia bacterium]|nr:SLBB domain-containing protein [Candidatus Neomarinimicrobiota bacterium]